MQLRTLALMLVLIIALIGLFILAAHYDAKKDSIPLPRDSFNCVDRGNGWSTFQALIDGKAKMFLMLKRGNVISFTEVSP